MRYRRLNEYLTAGDLNTDACVNLAAATLSEQAQELEWAAKRAASQPTRENLDHLKNLRDFYKSDWFKVLSCGLVDGPVVAEKIIKGALRGRRL